MAMAMAMAMADAGRKRCNESRKGLQGGQLEIPAGHWPGWKKPAAVEVGSRDNGECSRSGPGPGAGRMPHFSLEGVPDFELIFRETWIWPRKKTRKHCRPGN
jgi:hypothetical protein